MHRYLGDDVMNKENKETNQEDKETEDWLAVLSGQSVPDANPEIIREAQALRVALKFCEFQALRTEPEIHHPPNPQILKNIFKATGLEPGWRRDLKNIWKQISHSFQSLLRWKLTLPFPAVAAVALLLLIVIPLIIPEQEPNMIGIPKTSPVLQELTVSNPQASAEALTIGLAKLGITVTLVKNNEVWIVEVADLSADNPGALSTLLKKHHLKRLPPPRENQLSVYISAK
jgi:hypothetical protein